MEGQTFLFHEPKCFFYITNLPKRTMPAARIVAESNLRCDQENIFAQGKGIGALAAPLHDLTSNWAGDAGLEPEVLAQSLAEAGWQRNGSRETSGSEETFVANGFFNVPSAVCSDPCPGSDSRSPVDLLTSVMVTRNRTNLPAPRIRQHATASLMHNQERQVTSDFRTRPPQPIRS